MTLDELSARFSGLEDARTTAERELAKLRGAREEIEALERDADALPASYEHSPRTKPRGDVPLDVSNSNSTTTRASSTNVR